MTDLKETLTKLAVGQILRLTLKSTIKQSSAAQLASTHGSAFVIQQEDLRKLRLVDPSVENFTVELSVRSFPSVAWLMRILGDDVINFEVLQGWG